MMCSDNGILIYTPQLTSRISYVLKYVFNGIFGIKYRVTHSVDAYLRYGGRKLNYSNRSMLAPDIEVSGGEKASVSDFVRNATSAKNGASEGVFLYAHGLLFETKLHQHQPHVSLFRGVPAIYSNESPDSILPFDVFSAIFYMISRYEEYLPHTKDGHGRFPAVESLAFKENFLHRPVVDLWLLFLKDVLHEAFPDLVFKVHEFSFVPTIDVDIAFAHKARELSRIFGGMLKMLLKKDFSSVKERFRVLLNLEKDPYDTFDFVLDLCDKYGLAPVFFILFGKRGVYDNNISNTKKRFHQLIRELNARARVGIHPSYGSHVNFSILENEIATLSGVAGKKINLCRFHFLKFDLPASYRKLLQYGITDDYTMGFADQPGFRAGTSRSFNFFDLENNAETALRVHPFALMDGTLLDYLRLDNAQSLERIKVIIDEIKAVDGVFISLWHNHTLSEKQIREGWKTVYTEMFKYGAS